MKFTTVLFALAGAGFAAAQNAFKIPPGGYAPEAGKQTNITWDPTTQGTVTLYLRSGNPAYLDNGTAIASSIPNNGAYIWSVPSNILRGDSYTFEIVSDADTGVINFSSPFSINSDNLYSSTYGISNGVAVSTAPPSGSASGSVATKTSGSASASSGASSGSMSGTSSAASTTGSVQPLTSSRQSGAAGARATAAAGMLGVIAMGALAL